MNIKAYRSDGIAPILTVYAKTLEGALEKATEEFENDKYSTEPKFNGFVGIEFMTVRCEPDRHYPSSFTWVFACFK